MRASILVRDPANHDRIEQRFDSTIDEHTVQKVKEMLQRRYPKHRIDTSQIDLARQAQTQLIELAEHPLPSTAFTT